MWCSVSEKQKHNCQLKRRADIYNKINHVFEHLPNRFKCKELFEVLNMEYRIATMWVVVSVLTNDFKCISCGQGGYKYFKKPNE